jgi:ElaA protein
MMHWEWLPFGQLDAERLYRILQARSAVFVVEQDCVYQDVDGLDPQAWHLMAWGADDQLAAYLRVLMPGAKYPEYSIGRVLSSTAYRGSGMGRELVLRALARIEETFGHVPIRISAQAYLLGFYRSFGFVPVSEEYLEDGIAHVDMLREAASDAGL